MAAPYPEPFDAAQALADLQAAGIVVSRHGFAFPDGCGDREADAMMRLTREQSLAVMELAEAGQ